MSSSYDAAREVALKILERRRRTRADLAQRLKEKGHAPADILGVCDRLEELGILNDREFARLYLRGRASRPRGNRLLLQELRNKGVPAELAEEVLHLEAAEAEAEQPDADDAGAELERARLLARQSARKLVGLGPREARNKLFQLLGRRGFGMDVIERVARELARGDDSGD